MTSLFEAQAPRPLADRLRPRSLAEIVGRPARLVREGTVKAPYGYAPVHLLTTASLAAFAAHYPTSRFAAERFRPNILLDTGRLEGFVESCWIGPVLATSSLAWFAER